MKYNRTNNVIQLYPSAPAVREGLDFAAVNRRATLRFRAAERRRNVVNDHSMDQMRYFVRTIMKREVRAYGIK